jgi:hypothetical protein
MGIAANFQTKEAFIRSVRQFFDSDLSKVSAKKRVDRAMAMMEAEISSNSHSANRRLIGCNHSVSKKRETAVRESDRHAFQCLRRRNTV